MSAHDEFLARIQQKGCALLSVSCPEFMMLRILITGGVLPSSFANRLGKVTIFPTSLNTYPGLGEGAGARWVGNAVLNLKLPC